MRIHPSAREVTAPLGARAVTIGRDIYFHPGQYQPGLPQGDALIAHELAHSLQTREQTAESGERAGDVSEPGDALEENADALAAGETTHPLSASPGAMLRTPFDSESAADQARRQTLLRSISNAIQRILRLLGTGGLLQNAEIAVERNGLRGVVTANTAGTSDEMFFSYQQRDARLRRIVRELQAMEMQYRSAPIEADFRAPVREESGTYRSEVRVATEEGEEWPQFPGSASAEWADLQAAYALYRARGIELEDMPDFHYLEPDGIIVPGAARGAPRVRPGIALGVYLVVPDIERDPLHYWRLSGFSQIPRDSTIVEIWHDDFGYYYTHRGQRIGVPNPWENRQ